MTGKYTGPDRNHAAGHEHEWPSYMLSGVDAHWLDLRNNRCVCVWGGLRVRVRDCHWGLGTDLLGWQRGERQGALT